MTVTNRSPRPPADNNVQDVLTVIDGYQSGPIRALAQDPPQNSADARVNGGGSVHVEYRTHRRLDTAGRPVNLLTITDTGTTGLDGPVLTQDELRRRER